MVNAACVPATRNRLVQRKDCIFGMIHPQAIVDDPSAIDEETSVWAFAHVMAGAQIGMRCNIGEHAFIESGAYVGNDVVVKNHALIWAGIIIEDGVFVGPRVTFTNDLLPRSRRSSAVAAQKYDTAENWLLETVVETGASIGAGAVICPGIRIGCFAMVAAGSVVTKEVMPYSLVVGNPGRCVGYVCSCGSKLAGPADQTTCSSCGKTPQVRRLK